MEEEKIVLNGEEAIRIAQFYNNTIHCFINPSFGIVGATWDIEDFKDTLNKAKTIEVGGSMCRSMKHAIALRTENDLYFFEHNEEKLKKLLKERGIE